MRQLSDELIEFVFRQVHAREGRTWLGATREVPSGTDAPLIEFFTRWEIPLNEKTRQRLHGVHSIEHLLESFMLKGIRLDSHLGLWGLVSGRYALRLRTDIPTPREMLDLQCAGERYVSFLKNPEQLNQPVGRFSGAFDFLMHDLEHAHKFFGDPTLHRGQTNFFRRLRLILPRLQVWLSDPRFAADLDYLMSDMNSHPVHLFKYFKAIVLTAAQRREESEPTDFWETVLNDWQVTAIVRVSAHKINLPGHETSADQEAIHHFFCEPPLVHPAHA